MKLIRLLLFLSLLLALPIRGTAAPRPAQTGQTELTFAYFPLAVPISVLGETMQRDRILQRNLARQGVKLAFKPFAKGNDVIPLVREGRLAGVSVSDMPAIEAVIAGDMRILGFTKQSYSAIVAPRGTQFRNLRAGRIGNAYGSTSHYALLQALAAAGMSERDVILVPMNANDMLDALEAGKIDAFAAWEPVPADALLRYPGKYAQISRQTSYAFFLLSDSLIRSRPETAREITAALVRAIRWLKKREANLLTACRWVLSGVQAFTGRPSPLNEQAIAKITHDDLLDVPGAPSIPAQLAAEGSLLLKEFEFLKKIGKLPADASRERITQSFDARMMKEVINQPARYALNRFEYPL